MVEALHGYTSRRGTFRMTPNGVRFESFNEAMAREGRIAHVSLLPKLTSQRVIMAIDNIKKLGNRH